MDGDHQGPDLRRDAIRARLDRGAPLSLVDAARDFGVSVDTIRRDLKALEAEGRARYIRGGALPVARPVRPTLERLATSDATAERLAAAALPLIEDGMVIALDGGTSVLALAQRLPPLLGALVVTPSPAVALACLAAGIPTRIMGGRLSEAGAIAVGSDTVEAFASIAVDIAFLGACGLDADFGLSADDADEAHTKRAMIAASHRAVVLTGSAKIGRRARHRVVGCNALQMLVTDADARTTASLAQTGMEILNA